MARNWDLRLEKNGVSRMAYRELVYFCLQYAEKQRDARATATPQRRNALLQDIAMIEAVAREAAPDFGEELLRNVTARIPYEQLNVPCGRRQFYAARRRFFLLLFQKREKEDELYKKRDTKG